MVAGAAEVWVSNKGGRQGEEKSVADRKQKVPEVAADKRLGSAKERIGSSRWFQAGEFICLRVSREDFVMHPCHF